MKGIRGSSVSKDQEMVFVVKKPVWLEWRVKRDEIRGLRKLRLLFREKLRITKGSS